MVCKIINFFDFMQDDSKKNTHGGARAGAGRKATVAKQIAVGIPADVVEILDRVQGSRSAWIVAAIRAYAENH